MDLTSLADKYENKEFLIGDPSWFMHQVEGEANKELLAFVASCLSYGSRKQFLPKIEHILQCSKDDMTGWLSSGRYNDDIPATDECYYRLYTCRMMNDMLTALAAMVREYGTMRGFVEHLKKGDKLSAIEVTKALCEWFRSHGSEGIVPKNISSSCKRVCMFLRWMVRDNSPVDLGIWSDLIDKRSLIIPMDTHVVQEANNLGLVSSRCTSMSAAMKLTSRLAEIFPDDPLKGDFALFGYGINKT